MGGKQLEQQRGAGEVGARETVCFSFEKKRKPAAFLRPSKTIARIIKSPAPLLVFADSSQVNQKA